MAGLCGCALSAVAALSLPRACSCCPLLPLQVPPGMPDEAGSLLARVQEMEVAAAAWLEHAKQVRALPPWPALARQGSRPMQACKLVGKAPLKPRFTTRGHLAVFTGHERPPAAGSAPPVSLCPAACSHRCRSLSLAAALLPFSRLDCRWPMTEALLRWRRWKR